MYRWCAPLARPLVLERTDLTIIGNTSIHIISGRGSPQNGISIQRPSTELLLALLMANFDIKQIWADLTSSKPSKIDEILLIYPKMSPHGEKQNDICTVSHVSISMTHRFLIISYLTHDCSTSVNTMLCAIANLLSCLQHTHWLVHWFIFVYKPAQISFRIQIFHFPVTLKVSLCWFGVHVAFKPIEE